MDGVTRSISCRNTVCRAGQVYQTVSPIRQQEKMGLGHIVQTIAKRTIWPVLGCQ
jgi:UTP-glucose-1-phosphate uridylyltransferase